MNNYNESEKEKQITNTAYIDLCLDMGSHILINIKSASV